MSEYQCWEQGQTTSWRGKTNQKLLSIFYKFIEVKSENRRTVAEKVDRFVPTKQKHEKKQEEKAAAIRLKRAQ